MARSWLKCLFNPAGSARIINGLTESVAVLEGEKEKLSREVDTLRMSAMTARETALIQERRIDASAKEILDRDRQIADLRRQLEEASIEQEQLDEIERMISEFEKEKKRYEKRIATLHLQLKDAREAVRRLSRPEFEDNPRPIELSELEMPDPPEAKSGPGSSSDWLQSLPEEL